MKRITGLIIGLSVLGLMASCALNDAGKGDAAYEQSKRATGDQQRLLQKTAYMRYNDYLKSPSPKLTPRFRNRFAEMVLIRAKMIIDEGTADKDAIPLLIADLDKVWSPEIQPDLKKSYADILVQLADSIWSHGMIMESLGKVDKAIEIADDKSTYEAKRKSLAQDIIKGNFEAAKAGFEQGKKDKDEEKLVRAEYDVQVSLLFDSTNAEAKALLSEIRKANTGYYSAYRKVLDPIPDTTIYRKVNNNGILLAVASMSDKGSMEIMMYNYSYNPLRLKPENFFIVDDNGKKYQASPASKIEKEILDQEHETKFKLFFPKASAPLAKIVYESGEYIGTKLFK